jgi:hypothetical protein
MIHKLFDWKHRSSIRIPRWIKWVVFRSLRITQCIRRMPDYCIIGGQKCGTDSIYYYLSSHLGVRRSVIKEINYFSKHFEKGSAWYRSNFPINCGRRFITGEGSTMYLYSSDAPMRMLSEVPRIKLIVMLRDPVDRAISHYYHRLRSGKETRSIGDAFASALEHARRDEFVSGTETDYLSYGNYAMHLKQWVSVFTPENLMVIQAEEYFSAPESVYERICCYLEIGYVKSADQIKMNAGSYDNQELDFISELKDYFRPLNEALYSMDQIKFRWENKL